MFLFEVMIFSAGFVNTGRHFVAIMKTNTNEFVLFDDTKFYGFRPYDGAEKCDFAVYQLRI